jgi:putative hydrolase of the HAD superfamily
MLEAPIALLEGAAETVEALARERDLMLITKGDLFDQESKLERSGLRDYFRHVEVVTRKEPATYQRILQRHGLDPAGFVMVGDSLRSDVLPVLAIGGRAVHIPCATPWQHELVETPELPATGWVRLERIADVPRWVDGLQDAAARPRTSR